MAKTKEYFLNRARILGSNFPSGLPYETLASVYLGVVENAERCGVSLEISEVSKAFSTGFAESDI